MSVSLGVDSDTYRQALALWGGGVSIITTRQADKTPVGFTVSAFSALSLQPPLVLFCMDHASSVAPAFLQCMHFGVNVLAQTQQALSLHFANSEGEGFKGIACHNAPANSPWLEGCLTHLECLVQERLQRGDHWIVIGLVEALQVAKKVQSPLIHWQRQYHILKETRT